MPSASASARVLPTTLRNASVTLPSAFMCGYRLNDWKTMPIFCRTRLMSTSCAVMSVPSTTTEPLEGSSSRLQQRSSVDLPEPDGPMMKTSSPCATARLMPFSTSRVPKDLCSPLTSRIAIKLRALRRIGTRVVAVHSRHAVARRHLVHPRVLLRLDAEPLLVEPRHGAVELHALQHVVHLSTAFLVVDTERHRPDEAGLVRIGRLHRRVLLRRPQHHGMARHVGVGTPRKHGLHSIGIGAVDVELEAVLFRVGLGPGLVGRALVDGDRLALQVLEALDVLVALLLQ